MNVIMTDESGGVDLMMTYQTARMTPIERAKLHDRARCGLYRLLEIGTALHRPAFDEVFRKIEKCPCFGRGTFEGPCDCEKLDLLAKAMDRA